jgi:hypothetical protein
VKNVKTEVKESEYSEVIEQFFSYIMARSNDFDKMMMMMMMKSA